MARHADGTPEPVDHPHGRGEQLPAPELDHGATPEMGTSGRPHEAVDAPLDHRPGTSGVATPGGGWRRADGPSLKRERRKRKGGGRGRDGDPTVEDAEFQSYYGRQIVKSAVWKTPDVPLYLFLGGAAGSSAVLGAAAEFTDRPALARTAHLIAGGGAIASVGFLIHDLGRPERFLHMLRVFKPTSPLSVGSYILSPFSALTGAAAALTIAENLSWVPGWVKAPWLRKTAGVGGAVFGGPMAAYTAVLLANTATPSWHEPGNQLPFVFTGSGLAAGGGLCMAFTPVDQASPARKAAVVGAAVELAAMHKVEHDHGIVSEPFHIGRAGKLLRIAKACTAAGAVGAAVLGGRRWGAVASGALLAAGSALTRFGVFDAGMASSKDPKYVVVPQRERLAARAAAEASTG
ncbi:NrfD/PsrC family molybdoenzyme membrane anchor subunit [Klenkia brasiliensis]|uniref:Formate-dependent nitrite reductase, membrane component NrfD n=1 Tax=Klenkia brasiliensis TaxID=333142 RepID=A0A1G7MXL9_9ACTN|nr:NrfD/PsrC family molybdoenzyme membrane anchor subunit [Klenkia brasiliensis]SDF65800.1 Formate-dependent nitrite reductase, membrane component NrfD [Klenkia brasiliensis]